MNLLGKTITDYIIENNINEQEFANQAELSLQTVKKIKNTNSSIKPKTIEKISDVLGISISEVLRLQSKQIITINNSEFGKVRLKKNSNKVFSGKKNKNQSELSIKSFIDNCMVNKAIISKEHLAKLAGVTPRTILNIEKGRKVKDTTLHRLENVLGNDFFNFIKQKQNIKNNPKLYIGSSKKAIAYRLKKLRTANCLSVQELKDITNTNYSLIENGHSGLKISLAVTLSDYFGVSLDYLIKGKVTELDKNKKGVINAQ